MSNKGQKTQPAPTNSRPGTQKDDNIDDLGRRPDGTEQDQPVNPDTDNDDKSRSNEK